MGCRGCICMGCICIGCRGGCWPGVCWPGVGVVAGLMTFWSGVAGRGVTGSMGVFGAGLWDGCFCFRGFFCLGGGVAPGGGMAPPEGPYMSTGRFGGSTDAGFGSRTPYMVASNMCGSTVMITWPSLTMESLAGFLGSSAVTPRRFEGLDQYFSKMPSLIHLLRDRDRDSARTPLCLGQCVIHGDQSKMGGRLARRASLTSPGRSGIRSWEGLRAAPFRQSAGVCSH